MPERLNVCGVNRQRVVTILDTTLRLSHVDRQARKVGRDSGLRRVKFQSLLESNAGLINHIHASVGDAEVTPRFVVLRNGFGDVFEQDGGESVGFHRLINVKQTKTHQQNGVAHILVQKLVVQVLSLHQVTRVAVQPFVMFEGFL